MAQQITKIRLPICTYAFEWATVPYVPEGSVTVAVWDYSDLVTPLGQATVNCLDMKIISKAKLDSLPQEVSWEDWGVLQSEYADFVFTPAINLSAEPDAKYVISVSLENVPDSTRVVMGGIQTIISPISRYDFIQSKWVSDYQTPHQDFGFYVYDGDLLIGEKIPHIAQGPHTTDYQNYKVGYATWYGNGLDPSVQLPPQADSPDPADKDDDVPVSTTSLSWGVDGNDAYITHYEVYFDDGIGTLPDEPTKIVFTKSCVIGYCLSPSFTYKWRVDTVNATGTTEGQEWEFTTDDVPFIIPHLTHPFVWASKTGDYENFEIGTKDADAYELAITSTNEIRWIESLESLLVGTAGDEWRIYSNKLDTPITPTNFTVKRQGRIGSALIQPAISNEVILFLDRFRQKIYEAAWSGENEKYVSNDMCALAEHITYPGVVNMAFQKNPEPILWCVLSDGQLISFSYDRSQNVAAWAKHPIDGKVQSVCVLPGREEDEIWLSVQRTIDEEDKVYIEKMASRRLSSLDNCFFVDCGVQVPAMSKEDTIEDLEYLEGKTVSVLADGVYLGDFEVKSGEVELPDDITADKIFVGLPYKYVLMPMRIVAEGQDGSTMGKMTRIDELSVVFLNSLGVQYGPNESNLFDVNFDDIRLENDNLIEGLKTCDVRITMPGGHSVQNPILITGKTPYPCTVKAIVAKFNAVGR